MNYQPSDYLPIIVQIGAALAFIVLTMVATHWLGPKRHSKAKDDVFECGIESVGNARTPISVKYFLWLFYLCFSTWKLSSCIHGL
jgi:NADH-quinone oxidoreductase subunit A